MCIEHKNGKILFKTDGNQDSMINRNKPEMHAASLGCFGNATSASHLPKLAYKLDVVNKREAWFSVKIKAQHLKMEKLRNILQYCICNLM